MMQQTCSESRRKGKVDRYGSLGKTRKTQRNKARRKKIVEVMLLINFFKSIKVPKKEELLTN